MSLLSETKYDLYILKQMVARAKEAKANQWSYEGMDPRFRATSPGELYEYLMGQIPDLVEKIEGNLKKLGGKK